jgi:formylglycine-generating enzyme required for sulfatase activity
MNPQISNPPPLPDLDLIFVEGGTFTMGDEKGDLWSACRPTHEVKVSSFYMGKYPVTQRLWQAMMGITPRISKAITVR